MHTLLTAYLVAFVLTFWPSVATHPRQFREMRECASEVASLPTPSRKMLRLMNTAALESGFRHDAKGALGECGPWQILGGRDCSAREALRRMDEQGLVAYVGCRHAEDHVVIQWTPTTCAELIAHRIDKADLYAMGFDPPPVPVEGALVVAGNP